MKLAAILIGTASAFSISGRSADAFRGRIPRYGISSLVAGDTVRIEGDTLKTWDLAETSTERVQLSLCSTNGRPLEASVELWHTPAYVPTKFTVYCEDGVGTPFQTIIETPKHPKTLSVHNDRTHNFPLEASVVNAGVGRAAEQAGVAGAEPKLIQGGKIADWTFGPEVEAIAILLKTEDMGKRNMKAMIEITSGPNDDNQEINLYASDGYKHPFYTIMKTPGPPHSLRIINKNTLEFPFDAYVVPCEFREPDAQPPVAMPGSEWA